MTEPPFTVSAEDYDLIYQTLPYDEQAESITAAIRTRRPGAETLLEVGCGTGQFLVRLQKEFIVEGVDLSAEMLAVARRRVPDVRLHRHDMREFDLGRRFDAVACLFSSIGYMTTLGDVRCAIENFLRHLNPGGVLIVDPWLTPDGVIRGYVGADLERDGPGYAVARLSHMEVRGRLSVMDLHHLVGRADGGVAHYVERHEMGLFTDDEYAAMFAELGMDAERTDDVAWSSRSRWIAVAP